MIRHIQSALRTGWYWVPLDVAFIPYIRKRRREQRSHGNAVDNRNDWLDLAKMFASLGNFHVSGEMTVIIPDGADPTGFPLFADRKCCEISTVSLFEGT